jgi:hypothetical protein
MKFYRKLRTSEHRPVGKQLLCNVRSFFFRVEFKSIFSFFVVQVPEELEGTDENGLVDGIIPPQPKERFPNC